MQRQPLGPREPGKQTAMPSGHLQHECDAERRQRLLTVPCQLLDLVEYGIAHTPHQAVWRVRCDLVLDNEYTRLLRCCSNRGEVTALAGQEVVDPLGKLFLGGDLLQRDNLHILRELAQLLTDLLSAALCEEPGEGGNLQQAVRAAAAVAPDTVSETLLLQPVESFGSFSLLVFAQRGFRQPAREK